jgi:hypothetical protein
MFLKANVVFIFRRTEAKITELESDEMPYANGIARYGSARLRITARMPKITTPWSFISAVGAGTTCHNVDHPISATLAGSWNPQRGVNTWWT